MSGFATNKQMPWIICSQSAGCVWDEVQSGDCSKIKRHEIALLLKFVLSF